LLSEKKLSNNCEPTFLIKGLLKYLFVVILHYHELSHIAQNQITHTHTQKKVINNNNNNNILLLMISPTSTTKNDLVCRASHSQASGTQLLHYTTTRTLLLTTCGSHLLVKGMRYRADIQDLNSSTTLPHMHYSSPLLSLLPTSLYFPSFFLFLTFL
jgi:hypothetical protein